jgi:DNA mismatch repair protein MutS
MRQYHNIKRQYPDAILFFRMGDFYETFYEDAKIASRVLGIALTSRDKNSGEPIPLAGVPHHAADSYLTKFIKAGYKVAICEQVEDPKKAKGLVKRDVIRVITPGTVIEPNILDKKSNNYLASISQMGDHYGFAHVDLSTGEFSVTELETANKLMAEVERVHPAECLVSERFEEESKVVKSIVETVNPAINHIPGWVFSPDAARSELIEHFHTLSLDGFGCENMPSAISAAGALIYYLKDTQKQEVEHIKSLSTYSLEDHMILDADTQRNLELMRALRDGSTKGTLLEVLDETLTPMGGRRLRHDMLRPLIDVKQIQARLDAIAEFHSRIVFQDEFREILKDMHDMERLIARISLGTGNARDMLALRSSLRLLPLIKEKLSNCEATLLCVLNEEMEDISDVAALIERSIYEDPPVTLTEGNIIKDGYNAELDELRGVSSSGKEWIAKLQETERKRTKISSLKIGYNDAFGYYIEVTKSNLHLVPEDYIRKQTLVNSERYITPELKEYESRVLNAQERIEELEYEVFCEIRDQVAGSTQRIQKAASIVAMLDVLSALAHVASKCNYVKPNVNDSDEIIIKDGRHPVVERYTVGEGFVPNDLFTDCDEHQMLIITGPNMSGKCLSSDTMIFTDQGLVPIVDLMPDGSSVNEFARTDCQVQGTNSRSQVTHFYNGGRQATLKLTTRLGYHLEGTPEHKVWVRFPDGSEGWKLLGDVAGGDFVAIDRQIDLWGEETGIDCSAAESLRKVKRYRLPSRLDEDLAYIMGLLVGDGTLTYTNCVSLSTGDPFIADEYSRIVKELFGYRPRCKPNGKDYSITSKQIRVFLEALDLKYVRSYEKHIPQSILRAPRHIVIAFLQGLFDADGSVENRYGNVRFSTSSISLARQVQLLLLNLGIIASIHVKKTKCMPNYRLFIDGADAIAFHQQIGFRLPRKKERSSLASDLRMPNVGGIPHMESVLKKVQQRIVATKDKPVALKHNRSVNSIFYTYIPSGRNISYSKLDELISYCRENGVECTELECIAARRYFYDPVVRIEPGEADVYDLSVVEDHAYVAGGLVSHNSTYLRQVALITLMAQMGSFVPASEASIGIVDRIFTRVGASDNLVMGRSTFLVEMNETANILNNATRRSLLILDEIGRGTSTYDGLSIAWAVAEHILDKTKLGARTLFATHYHELIELGGTHFGAKNYNVAVREWNDQVVFLRKIVEGGTDQSYGIHVAQLAGLPSGVIERAREILEALEKNSSNTDEEKTDVLEQPQPVAHKVSPETKYHPHIQLSLFGSRADDIVDELNDLDITNMTPLQALNKLQELKKKAEN